RQGEGVDARVLRQSHLEFEVFVVWEYVGAGDLVPAFDDGAEALPHQIADGGFFPQLVRKPCRVKERKAGIPAGLGQFAQSHPYRGWIGGAAENFVFEATQSPNTGADLGSGECAEPVAHGSPQGTDSE